MTYCEHMGEATGLKFGDRCGQATVICIASREEQLFMSLNYQD